MILTPGLTHPQEGPDLGHRLHHIIATALAQDYGRVVIVSSDVPHLPEHVVDAAFQALEHADVVLAPSEDGGYHLVGLTQAHDIFTMVPMSTPAVFDQTVAAIAAAGLRLQLLDSDFDIDEPADLERLAAYLEHDHTLRASHTAAALKSQLDHSRMA